MIDASKILQSELIDLLFDGRNKNYGAYELRKNYHKRVFISVAIMLTACLLLLMLYSFTGRKSKSSDIVIIDSFSLTKVEPEAKKPEVIPPPPKTIQPPVKTIQFTTPKITPQDIKPEEQMPDLDTVAVTKIGTVNQAGADNPDAVAPPISSSNGVIDEPKKHEDDVDKIFVSVQIESEYPGGLSAWQRYLNRELPRVYTDDLTQYEGRVVVQFIVDKEGNVSEAHGIEGPKELWEIAERTIMKSGKWKPAIQNGRPVKSYKSQPIIFKSEDSN